MHKCFFFQALKQLKELFYDKDPLVEFHCQPGTLSVAQRNIVLHSALFFSSRNVKAPEPDAATVTAGLSQHSTLSMSSEGTAQTPVRVRFASPKQITQWVKYLFAMSGSAFPAPARVRVRVRPTQGTWLPLSF